MYYLKEGFGSMGNSSFGMIPGCTLCYIDSTFFAKLVTWKNIDSKTQPRLRSHFMYTQPAFQLNRPHLTVKPRFRKPGWRWSGAAQSRPRTRYQPQGRAGGHPSIRSDSHIW